MKPKNAKTRGIHCQNGCSYLKQYEHPFYNHNAWCSYLLRELNYYDGFLQCSCKTEEPDPQLTKLVELGYSKDAN